MDQKRWLLSVIMLLVLLCSLSLVSAATLHGKIYDIELNELNDVIVEVDSSPVQRFVSKDGEYSFSLDPGEYVLTAKYSPDAWGEQTTTEKVSITKDGDYVFDLFMFPEFDAEDEQILTEPDSLYMPEAVIDENGAVSGLNIAIGIVIVIILLLVIYYFVGRARSREIKDELEEAGRAAKQRHAESATTAKKHHAKHAGAGSETLADSDLDKVVEIIKKEGGRTTQKELRKYFPLSEAKISLMISELEHKKIVQKVKKGRGNIIILKNH